MHFTKPLGFIIKSGDAIIAREGWNLSLLCSIFVFACWQSSALWVIILYSYPVAIFHVSNPTAFNEAANSEKHSVPCGSVP